MCDFILNLVFCGGGYWGPVGGVSWRGLACLNNIMDKFNPSLLTKDPGAEVDLLRIVPFYCCTAEIGGD